ncbi:hypothetical protein A0H81_07519 [Grifola frondosa]|uniref:Steroid 5-alpha reductase C-terminal domain-containing protein n=1 Tax=Grifola frondosa TaxID=5627 RepID=A0A1C7M6Z0_GRIFR|nr:hypothetical protein A0H81_07519 [Grifola frondosa]
MTGKFNFEDKGCKDFVEEDSGGRFSRHQDAASSYKFKSTCYRLLRYLKLALRVRSTHLLRTGSLFFFIMATVMNNFAVEKGIPAVFHWPVTFLDRLWTFLPTIYTAYYALLPLWPLESFSPRALLMLGLVSFWMCRLSYNTWRRGLFNLKDEDYRWIVVRSKIPTWLFQVFNLVFIAVMQNIILFLLGIPAQIAALQQPSQLSTSDYILATLAVLDVIVEFIADNQQYSFQTYKQRGVLRGFVTRGLWAWSRHPNFLCEQTFWILINLFPLLAPESPQLPSLPISSITPLWPITPALVLCMLFFSSTRFTEDISLSKYPEGYRAYQSRVAMFVPLLTPVWGLLLKIRGKKDEVDELLFGQGRATDEKDD